MYLVLDDNSKPCLSFSYFSPLFDYVALNILSDPQTKRPEKWVVGMINSCKESHHWILLEGEENILFVGEVRAMRSSRTALRSYSSLYS